MPLTLPLQLKLDPTAQQHYDSVITLLLHKMAVLSLPAVVGISGAQGSGKSTLAALLVQQLTLHGIKAAAVSLDDYYLSKVQRTQLAQSIHPLLAQRGVPGTHNIQQAIKDAYAVLAGEAVTLPKFDKALDEPAAPLPLQQLDILIVEGWCVGVTPQTEAELAMPVNTLEASEDEDGRWRHYINAQLAGPYTEYWHLLKSLIWLQAPNWDCVCRWRARQEQQLWQERGSGMTDIELARFMLPFQRLTQAGWQQMPQRANSIITLDQQQNMTLITGR